MEIERYMESIRRQVEAAAASGGDDARAVAERLVPSLEAAIRLAVQDALSDAAEEITLELAPGSVELRVRGRELEFVVSLPPGEVSPAGDDLDDAAAVERRSGRGEPGAGARSDETLARINLRLPERLKSRVELAAADDGLSVNSWLVRAAASAVERGQPNRRGERRTPQGAQRYRGWAR